MRFKDKFTPSNRMAMLLVFSVIILLFSSIALISSSMALTAADRIFYGVKLHDLPLGGLTKEAATQEIAKFYTEKASDRALFLLRYQDKTWEIGASDIDFEINAARTAEKAYGIGRESGLFKKLWMRIESVRHGIEITGEIRYNKEKLQTIVAKIAASFSPDAKNAYCSVTNGQITIHPESVGEKLDPAILFGLLDKKMRDLTLPAAVSLPIEQIAPSIVAAQLKDVDRVLATYTSYFDAYNVNRSENIKIAAGSVNRLLIAPGEIISFNDLVGLRVVEAGFKEAPVIIDGKTVPDIGGGICQVSSTLYNAILLADLKPVERTPHFHPLGYVPIGLDATVADNLLDFKFQNSLNRSVYVISEIIGGNLTVTVLGNAANLSEAKITLTSNIDKTLPAAQKISYDSSLPAGKTVVQEEGLAGYIVSSYRVKTLGDQEISRELLYVDEYTPEDEVVVIGTKRAIPKAPAKEAAQAPAKAAPPKRAP